MEGVEDFLFDGWIFSHPMYDLDAPDPKGIRRQERLTPNEHCVGPALKALKASLSATNALIQRSVEEPRSVRGVYCVGRSQK
jgi:hypothetical protein